MNKYSILEKFDTEKIAIKELFSDLWSEKLSLDNISIHEYYPTNVAMYNILTSVKTNINEENYDDFNELFVFLKSSNTRFQLSESRQLVIKFKDINKFLTDLEAFSNSKKYNL